MDAARQIEAEEYLQIEGAEKYYPGGVHAVRGVSMDIRQGEFIIFVGPSGCGKTTLLRMIAGLESISSGVIRMEGQAINRLPPRNRDIAMVFQNYALYPNMKVAGNIAFPLKMKKLPRGDIPARVGAVAQTLGLGDLLERRPAALSGGQRQRVALARAMVRHPRLFLMDEPLSNLDAKLRADMRREIVALQRQLGVTTIYVTHDQTEAMTMGDRMAVMNEGVLQQLGTPREVYERPQNLFVAQFIGSPPMNLWPGRVEAGPGGLALLCGDGDIRLSLPPGAARGLPVGRELVLGLRPEHLRPVASDAPDALSAVITAVENTGRESLVFAHARGLGDLVCATGGSFAGRAGQAIGLLPELERLHAFDPESGERVQGAGGAAV